ncbi:alpha-amylase family glycosyl hydrolase [Paucibacter sp. PLA-PC-4]|uniref:alpha-amylase family glycosyl hydrolase n=1 Tax=Paucibacter sp. PLA-PC-4 TaxID=2993655 RepID=UPI00224B8B9E|nr:alpha-amylase family glycosyl hydrolase [Paucibacter sp. PLA-PC-4]MCX2864719.1 alpha-amylase family glycosyl hydrolase [Paucibacter sp. PLA-PC-4]
MIRTILLAVAMGGSAAAVATDLGPVPARDPGSRLAPGWQHGAFIEIFVRGYQDSDGDGIGDLRGLTARLDYLQALGIKGIWLMPITASADRDHGYATTDFRALEPQYGSLADFDEFIRQAHRRGIGVIIDYVINHSAAAHPLFQQALRSPASPYRDWFVWQQETPGGWDIWGQNPWTATPTGSYFATFGPTMPDFNLNNPLVRDYHINSLRFWLNRGLDGFRLDAVPHLVETNAIEWNDQPESRRLTKSFQELIKGYRQRHVVCEATANPQVYADPAVCGSAFAFGLERQIIKAARGEPAAIQAVADYFKTAPPTMATMLANHDIFAGARIWDQLAGDEAAYKLAAASYLLMPGTPFIYYGEEIGMAGIPGLPGDEPLRGPMSWHADGGFSSAEPYRQPSPNAASHNAAAQAADPNSLLNFYKAMLRLRNTLPAIARGSYEAAQVEGQVMSFRRRLGREQALVVINYGAQAAPTPHMNLPAGARLQAVYPRGQVRLRTDAQGGPPIPARSVAVYRIKP